MIPEVVMPFKAAREFGLHYPEYSAVLPSYKPMAIIFSVEAIRYDKAVLTDDRCSALDSAETAKQRT